MRPEELMETLSIDREAAEALILAGYSTLEELDRADLLDLALIRPVGTTGSQWIKAKIQRMKRDGTFPGSGASPVRPASSAPAPAPMAPPPPPTPASPAETAGGEDAAGVAPPSPGRGAMGPPPPPPHVRGAAPHVTGAGEGPGPAAPVSPPPADATDSAVPPAPETAPVRAPPATDVDTPAPAAPVVGGGGSLLDRAWDALFGSRKRMMISAGVLLVVAALIGVALWAMFTPQPAPDFTYHTTDGRTGQLSDHRGEIVVIDFMYSSCTACKRGMSELVEFYEKYKDDIVMLSISPYDTPEERRELRKLAEEKGATWTFATTDYDTVVEKYGVREFPTIFILDRDGYVVYQGHGDAGELGDEVEKVKEGRASKQALIALGVYGTAFLAGMLTFFSPCAYPLMPAYMSYYVTMEADDREMKHAVRRGMFQGAIPATAMLLFFGAIGLIVGLFGSAVLGYLGYLELIMGFAIVGFGILMLAEIDVPFHLVTDPMKRTGALIYGVVRRGTGGLVSKETAERLACRVTGRELRFDAQAQGSFGLFTYGLVYAAASSACVAPLFFLIVAFALSTGGVIGGLTVLLLYGLGMGVLMVTFTALLAAGRMKLINVMKKYMPVIKRISAVILIIAGLLLVYFWFTAEM